jgi:hypothetical protein
MRNMIIAILAIILAIGFLCTQRKEGVCAPYDETVIIIDGKFAVKTTNPCKDNGIVLAPAEETFKLMNAFVSVSGDLRQVTVEKNSHRVTLTVGSRNAKVDGISFDLGARSMLIDGKIHVPVIQVAENLQAYINRIPQKNATLIVTDFVRYADNISKRDYDKMVLNQADAIIRKVITTGMNDYQKVWALAKHIESIAQYDYKELCRYNHRPYGVFIAGYAICNGYAEAMQILLNKIGISNKIVHGSIIGRSGKRNIHAWNLVTINGQSFHLDITNNDASPGRGDEYLFLSDAEIEKSSSLHMIYNKDRYPSCGPYPENVRLIVSGFKKNSAPAANAYKSMIFLGELYNDGTGDSSTLNKGGNIVVVSADRIGENDLLVFKNVAGSSPSPKLCGGTPDGKYFRLNTGLSYGSEGVSISGKEIFKTLKTRPYIEFIIIINGDFTSNSQGHPYFYTKRPAKVKLYLQKN